MLHAPRRYTPNADFRRVRDFLAQTYGAFEAPVNWGIERWNCARYFVAPMLGSCGTDGGVPSGAVRAIRLWDDLVGVWERADVTRSRRVLGFVARDVESSR